MASSSIQPFGHNRHMPKTGGRAPFRGELGLHLTQRPWAEAYLSTKCYLDPSSRLATIDMGQKLGSLLEGDWVPRLTQFGLGRCRTKWHLGTEYGSRCHLVLLANVNSRSRSLYAIARPSVVCRLSSVCRLSVVCNTRAPYSGGSNFRQYFYGIWYLGSVDIH